MDKRKVYPYYFIIPALLIYTIFFIIPTLTGFGFSLTNWNAMSQTVRFVGLRNFITIFTSPNTLLRYIGNTFEFAVVTTIFKNILGLGLALVLTKKIRGSNMLRGIFFLPYVISPVVLGIVFAAIFSPTGLLNSILSMIGLESITRAWLFDLDFAFPAVMFVDIWRLTGFNMIIYIAGLQTIPNELYESADLDGANSIKKFGFITLPFLVPSITINLVLNAIQGLRVFDIVFVLTGGGPGNRTEVINTIVLRQYSSGLFGLSTAMGVVLFVITALASFIIIRFMAKRESDLN